MIEPLLHRVLIKPDDIQKKHGVIELVLDERKERAACTTGTIVAIGPSAWLDPAKGGVPPVSVGDRIVYARYGGKDVKDPDDPDTLYVMINDEDVQANIVDTRAISVA